MLDWDVQESQLNLAPFSMMRGEFCRRTRQLIGGNALRTFMEVRKIVTIDLLPRDATKQQIDNITINSLVFELGDLTSTAEHFNPKGMLEQAKELVKGLETILAEDN